MKKKGLTLFELLITIAVIGILVAILLPVYKAARDKAEKEARDKVRAKTEVAAALEQLGDGWRFEFVKLSRNNYGTFYSFWEITPDKELRATIPWKDERTPIKLRYYEQGIYPDRKHFKYFADVGSDQYDWCLMRQAKPGELMIIDPKDQWILEIHLQQEDLKYLP